MWGRSVCVCVGDVGVFVCVRTACVRVDGRCVRVRVMCLCGRICMCVCVCARFVWDVCVCGVGVCVWEFALE